MHGTTRHTRGPPHLLYIYRDTVLLGVAKSPLCSALIAPASTASQDNRLRTTPVAVGGWKAGLGTDGIVNFDVPRGGNGPCTRRRGVGGGRRGMKESDCANFISEHRNRMSNTTAKRPTGMNI